MRRNVLGVIGLVFLVAWIWLLVQGPRDGREQAIAGSCMRIGLVLTAIWLSLPQLTEIARRVPNWLPGALLACALIIAIRPNLARWVIPGLALFGLLQFIGSLFKPLPREQRRRTPSKGD